MTNQLTIHFPHSNITIEADNPDNLIVLSDFCKTEFGGYRATESLNELTVDKFDEQDSNRFNSKLFELGLI